MNDVTEVASLETLAMRINREHSMVEGAARSALEHALAAGEMLIEAKAQCAHGEWLPWLAGNTKVATQTASNWMRLARRRAEIPTDGNLTVNGALRLLADESASDDDETAVPSVHHTSKTPEHYTPESVLHLVRAALGGAIGLDPCAEPSNRCRAEMFYTADDDGLSKRWDCDTLFMNPPYGREIGRWVSKFRGEFAERGAFEHGIALVPARTDTEWWATLAGDPCCLWRGRMRFVDADGRDQDPAPFPSALFYLGTDPWRFAEMLGPYGQLVDIPPEPEVELRLSRPLRFWKGALEGEEGPTTVLNEAIYALVNR